MTAIRIALAVVLAAASGFWFHVLYGRGWANAYVQAQAAAGRLNDIVRQPYPTDVVTAAFATSLIPMAFQVLLFVLVRERLPGRSGVAKGFWYGLLLLAIGDELFRSPIMSLVVGNPVDVMLVQNTEHWVKVLVIGLLIGALVPAGFDRQLLHWWQGERSPTS